MVHQQKKDLLFFLAQPALGFLALGIRLSWRFWVKKRPLRLHLGCGPKYAPSFINVDANLFRRVDLWLDLRNPLPFPNSVIEGIYTLETLEHLHPDELDRLLLECRRVLQPGGFIRIGVPHLRRAAEAYLAGRGGWFSDWPRSYRSTGGRLSNLLFCDGQHRNGFDFSLMEEVLKKAGFTEIAESARGRSQWVDSAAMSVCETDADPGDPDRHLFVEARKPA